MNTVTFTREENPKLFDATYYPDGNKIVNEWFIRTQQRGSPWPEGKYNHLIEFTGDTNIKFNNMSKDPMRVNQHKSTVRYDIFNYLKGFNDKGFEQIIGTKGEWSPQKSIEAGMKQAVQTLINQALGKHTYYSTDSRRTSGSDKINKASIKKKTGKFVGYGTRGGKRRKKTRKKRGGVLKDIALNDIKVGQRYTVTITSYQGLFPTGSFRGTFEGERQDSNQNRFFDFSTTTTELLRPNTPISIALQEEHIQRVQQYNVGPNRDLARKINEYVGGRRKKKTRRKRGGMKKAATTKKASSKKTSNKPLKVDTTKKYDDVPVAKKQSPHNQTRIADFKDSSNLPLKSIDFNPLDVSFIQDGGGPCLSKLCKNKEKERLLKRKESRKRFGSIPEEFDDIIHNWERFSNESRMEVEHSPPEIKPGSINDPFRNLVVRKGGGEQAINQERFEWIKKQAKKVLDNKEFLKELEASTNIKIKKNINEIKKKLEKTTLEEVLRFNKKINKNQKGGNGDDTNACGLCLNDINQDNNHIPSALWPFGPYTDGQGVVHPKCSHNRSFCINCLSKFSSFNPGNQFIRVCPICRAPRIRTQIERGMTLYHNLRDSVTLLDVGFLLTFVISSIMNVSDNNFTLGAFVLQGAIGLILWTIRDFNRDDRRQAQRRLNAQRRRQFPHFFDDDVLEGGGRKGGKKTKMPEKPIENYYYLINIYWPVGGTAPFTEIRYENVIGKYMGLASEVFYGWVDDELIPIPPYVFQTDLEDCEEGCIGKIVRKIGPSTLNIHTIGGRRKKKTRRKKRKKKRKKSLRK